MWGASASPTAATTAGAEVGKPKPREQLLGAAKFVRANPKSDRFQVLGYVSVGFEGAFEDSGLQSTKYGCVYIAYVAQALARRLGVSDVLAVWIG